MLYDVFVFQYCRHVITPDLSFLQYCDLYIVEGKTLASGQTFLIFNCSSPLFVLHLEKSKYKPPHGGGLVGLFSCAFALSYCSFKTFCPRGDNFVNATKCCYIFVAIADCLRGKKTKSKRIYAIYYLQKHVQPRLPEH